jgi:ribosomal protein S16
MKNSPTKTKTATKTMTRTPPQRLSPTPITPIVTKTNTNQTKMKEMSPTKTTPNTATKTTTKDKYANHPDYEYDTTNRRWVKKSDLRPIELVNRYKVFLTNYLDKNTMMELKDIKKLVNKHATSTKRLTKILVEKGMMTERQAKIFSNNYTFWSQELCKHMKKVCPTETNLNGEDWCVYAEDVFFYSKDKKTNLTSCYVMPDILNIISSSLTGGEVADEEYYDLLLQLPRDPYTRKVLDQEFISSFLKQIRKIKDKVSNIQAAHVLYFFRNYKKFYTDPKIKPFLKKTTLNKKEKQELSDAIEDFLSRTDEIEHGIASDKTIWWFWLDGKQPTDMYKYIYEK